MPAFKHKTTKQLLSDDRNITTLDSVHKEKQAEFNYIKTVVIPELKNEKMTLKAQLKTGSICDGDNILMPMSRNAAGEEGPRGRNYGADTRTYGQHKNLLFK